MNKIYIFQKEADLYSFATKLAAKKYNIDASKIRLARNAHDKPYFEDLPDFYFNLSHSGELKVLAVSEYNVGVDIEKMRKIDLRVAKRFCEDEYAYITENASKTAFLEVWTKKEAYLKYLGVGISGGLKSFSVFKTDIPLKTLTFDDYIISVCGDGDFEIVDLR